MNSNKGGVFAVVHNLLFFSKNAEVENHIIFTINSDIAPKFDVQLIEGAASQKVFYYSANSNFYYTCRQLAKLLPDDNVVIAAHDWLELGMVSILGLQNPVVQIVHGNYDYYYELATKHSAITDAYICISTRIFTTLKEKLSSRKQDIFHVNFPVPMVEIEMKPACPFQIIYYVGNLKDHNKQFSVVVEIAGQLADLAGDYNFTIAGGGMTENEFFELWPPAMAQQVVFLGEKSNTAILGFLGRQHVFLLPSLLEGLPVSLIEVMKAGVVPLVTDWNGGADELISEGITGYYFKAGASSDYVSRIESLNSNRETLGKISENCVQKANALFDPARNTFRFEDIFKTVARRKKRKKKAVKIYGSRLDQPWLGNTITSVMRKRFMKSRKPQP